MFYRVKFFRNGGASKGRVTSCHAFPIHDLMRGVGVVVFSLCNSVMIILLRCLHSVSLYPYTIY